MNSYDKNVDCYDVNVNFIDSRGFVVKTDTATCPADLGGIEFMPAREGGLTFSLARQGRKVTFHSPYNPRVEAERLVEKLDSAEIPDLIIVYGLGLGYHLPLLREKFGRKPQIVAVEPDPMLFGQILRYIELPRIIDENTQLVCTGDVTGPLRRIASCFNAVLDSKVLFVEHPVYVREYRDYFAVITEEFKRHINNQLINLATTLRFNETWMANTLRNLPDTCVNPGVNQLQGMFAGFPAVIVAAGPSLDKNVHLLKEVKGKAVIIGVGTSLRVLQKHGIVPDLLVTIDAGRRNYMHFEDMEYSDIPLVFDPIVYPDIVGNHRGKKFVAHIGSDIFKWAQKYLGEKGYLSTGGSVANVAYKLAEKIGANPIVFVGQDLAYTGDRTHAAGSTWENHRAAHNYQASPHHLQIPGYHGDMVWTSRAMYNYLIWFEAEVRANPGCTVINATEGGASIPGMPQMPLREVIEKYFTKYRDIPGEINDRWTSFTPQGVGHLYEALQDVKQRLRLLKKTCREGQVAGRDVLQKLAKSGENSPAVQSLLKRLDKIDRRLKKEKEITGFMNDALQAATLSVMVQFREMDKSQNKDLASLVMLSLNLYELIGDACTGFEEKFGDAVRQMKEEGLA